MTVVFAAIRSVLLDPMPYAQAGRLVQIRTDLAKGNPRADWVSWFDMRDLARETRAFSRVAVYHYSLFNLAGEGASLPEALYGVSVTANLLPTLGAGPMIGRNIRPEEERPGADVMILSYGLWVRRFAADRAVLGRKLQVNGHPCTIIGVMPRDFDFPMRMATTVRTPSGHMDFWASLAVDEARADRRGLGYGAVARLRDGATLAEARQEAAAVSQALEKEYPASNAGRLLRLNPLKERWLGTAQTGLALLMAASAVFLLIGCANVANLLLARAAGRARETAVRLALGANRARLAREFLGEACVLGLIGGAGGWALAALAWRVLPAVAPHSIPRLATAQVDGPVLAFALLASLVNSAIFGLAPAWSAARRLPAEALREAGTGGTAGGSSRWLRQSLVVTEVALAVVLVVTGGTLGGSFAQLLDTDPGFAADRVLASIIVPLGDQYRQPERRRALFRGILDGVQTIPGVQAVGTVDALPFSGQNNGAAVTADGAPLRPTSEQAVAEVDTISAGYLPALGVRLSRGRLFNEEDVAQAREVALVSESAAEMLWPGTSALGRRVCVNCEPDGPAHWKEIVGVVAGIRHTGLDERDAAQVYLAAGALENAQFLVMRTSGPSHELARAVRQRVAAIDPNQPVFLSAPMSRLIADSVADRRFILTLLGVTAGLALLLAAGGVYGVISYVTSRRTREIGVRIALGANPRQVWRLVFGEGMRLAAAGVVLGLIATAAIGRLLGTVLAGWGGTDTRWAVLAAVVVLAAAALACGEPARRATHVDPVRALR